MTYAFVLIDALPRREKDVFDSLGKVPAVVNKRLLESKVGGADIVALIQVQDEDAVTHLIENQLRSLHHIHSVRRVMPHHTVIGPIQRIMMEMEREASRKR